MKKGILQKVSASSKSKIYRTKIEFLIWLWNSDAVDIDIRLLSRLYSQPQLSCIETIEQFYAKSSRQDARNVQNVESRDTLS